MFRLYSILIGYIFGCFQTSFFLGKFYKIDIRNYGSGNAGTTNVNRVLGKKAGIIVFIIDIIKSVLAYLLCKTLFKSDLAGIWAGVGVILGHDFPFFLNFKGGKGIASTIGLVLVFNWHLAFIAYVFGIAAVLISRKISVGSLVFSFSLPLIFFNCTMEIFLLFIFISALAFLQHYLNIKRIINGNEPNFF